MKKLGLVLILAFTTFFSSCEKDLYEEQIYQENMFSGKKNYVTINDVPFLIPTIQKYDRKYNFLSDSNYTSNREIEDLDLDLNHILEYVYNNDIKSYSIAIKRLEDTDNMFFENLHIYEKEGVYKSIILKYDTLEEYKAFNLSSFNGTIEAYNLEKVLIGVMEIESGQLKHVKYFFDYGCWDLTIFNDLSYIISSSCGGGGGSESPSGENGTYAGTGTVYGGVSSSSSSGTNSTAPDPTDPTLIIHNNVVVPNEPEWPEFANQFTMANLISSKLNLNSSKGIWLKNVANQNVTSQIYQYLWSTLYEDENPSNDAEDFVFANEAIDLIVQNPDLDFNYFLYNRTILDDTSTGDIDNNTDGNYDNTVYSDFNPQQTWSNIPSVIPVSSFIGWNRQAHPNWQCMEYSKEQLRVMGYKISNYGSTGQTFQIYTAQSGVNNTALANGLSYLKYALSNNIPVIVGVDDAPGHPGNLDNTTDHFIVIVGMGTDSTGKYFQFYDNASGNSSQGTSPLNKLYYNPITGIISGASQTTYAQNQPYPYKITMIRKSKPL